MRPFHLPRCALGVLCVLSCLLISRRCAILATFCPQDMPGSPLRNPAPRVPAAAPVANAGGGRDRGTRNRDVAAFHNPMYKEVSINAVSTPGAAANAATTSQESDHGQIEPAPLASRKDSIDVGLDLSTFDDATPDGMAFGFGTGKAGTATAAAAYTAHAPSSSSGAAFGVGDRVEIVDKGAGTVRFVGLHHVEGTYGNSST